MKVAKVVAFIVFCSLIISCGFARNIRIPKSIPTYSSELNLQSGKYSAGVARNVIPPPDNAWLAGFNRGRKAYGIYDVPEVRALAISDGIKVFVFLTLDTIGLQRDDVIRIRESVQVSGAEVIIDEFSSHTHSAPDVIGLWGNGFGWGGKLPLTSGRNEKYIDNIVIESAKTINDAINNLETVDIIAATGISDLSKNRREPEILDKEISSLYFVSYSKKIVALIVNFGCHPETLHNENHLVSADFVSPLRDYLDNELNTTSLFINGSLGGMVQPNLSWKRSGDFKKMEIFGNLLARQVIESKREEPLKYEPIRYKKEVILIPLENKLFWMAGFLGFIPPRGIFVYKDIETEVSVMRIDNVNIVMIPGEIVPELGLEIKKNGGFGTQVWSLSNDEIGYILKKEKFYTKTFKYERTMSLGPEAGPIISNTAKKLIDEVKYDE